jgi:uroporphyrinogen decarboxylase
MTKRERVITAIKHIPTDFVPYHIYFTKEEYKKVAKHLGEDDFIQKIGNHIDSVNYDGNLTEVSPGSGYWRDDFGVIWNRNCVDKDIGVIDDIILKEPDLKNYKLPELDEKRLRSEFKTMMENGEDTFKIGSLGFSMFERAWTLRGMENLLMDMILEPNFVHELLDAITDYNLKIIDIGLEYDIDGFHFGDDWGQQKGLIMGPNYWRTFIKPRMAKMYQRAKSKGKIISQHSCGDIYEIFPDLIEIGLDVYQTFQPEIYDMRKVKEEFGNHLTFWGGISTQKLLPFASPEEIKKVTKETIEILGENGGYIAAPTHAVPSDVPAENMVALIEAFQTQK